MDGAASYVLSLCCGAILCSVFLSLTGSSGTGGSLRRMLCGLFLAFLAISPLKTVEFENFTRDFDSVTQEAESAADAGVEMADESLTAIITGEYQAYILNEAKEMGLQLEVQVTVDEETKLPMEIVLSGDATSEQKQVLNDHIRETLGIERSNLQWIN